MEKSSPERVADALVLLIRRSTDPRGNPSIRRRANSDLERASAGMLWRIGEHEPVRISTLAEMVGVEMSTASRQVASLVEAGYVTRGPDPDDGRATVHHLSPSGRDLRNRLVAARYEWVEGLLDEFDDAERATFAELLERFAAAMELARAQSK